MNIEYLKNFIVIVESGTFLYFIYMLKLSKYNELSRNIIWKKGKVLSNVAQFFLDEYDSK